MLDYIIVGFGLGGASTAFQLEKMGKSFRVFEDASGSSSKVAGGAMNPVILKRFTLAWRAGEQLPWAKEFYRELEAHLDTSFYSPVEIYRKFFSVEEQNDWFSAADKPGLAPYIDTDLKPRLAPGLPAEFSFGKVRQAGRVDTRTLLEAYTAQLIRKGILDLTRFDYAQLKLSKEAVEYQGERARKVIFCDGFGMLKNPFFNYLPLRGNKGEYIIIEAPGLGLEATVKSSVFISPLGGGRYAVGATYNNQDKTQEPTAGARAELEKKLRQLITVPYEVVGQVAGIRPTTADRRPLLGRHPEHPQLFCCNGFGSRGVLIAPWASRELLAHIEDGGEISEEVDVRRFRKRYGRGRGRG